MVSGKSAAATQDAVDRLSAELSRDGARIVADHMATAHPDLENRPRPMGHKRGLDVMQGADLIRAYGASLLNFLANHDRLPDIATLPKASDNVFASKFWRYFPVDPNPASKIAPQRFISDPALAAPLRQPRQVVFRDFDDFVDRAMGEVHGKVLLKPALGNNDAIRVDMARLGAQFGTIARHFRNTFARRYGVEWGEWPYGIGPQAMIAEEDMSADMTGLEYSFFMRGGQVQMWLCTQGNDIDKHTTHQVRQQVYFTPDGQVVDGVMRGRETLDPGRISSTRVAQMVLIAQNIARNFDFVRIDFIERSEGFAFGEMTLIHGNSVFWPQTDALEAQLFKAVDMHLSSAAEN